MFLQDIFESGKISLSPMAEDFTGRGSIPSLPVSNPKNIDPATLTTKEFLKIVNPDGKMHDDESYQTTADKMAKSGYLDYHLFTRFLRRIKVNGLEFEVRMREESGLTVSGKPYSEYTVAIYTDEKQPIAALQDEWGCVLLRVAAEYRGFGFGVLLGRYARAMFPDKPSGGFTPSGQKNFINAHREIIRDALANGFYRKQVEAGKMTLERVKEIVGSVDLKKKAPKEERNLRSSDPKDWLLMADGDGSFIVYDRKIKDLEQTYDGADHFFAEKMILAYCLVRIPDHAKDWGLFVRFGADTDKLKSFLITLASSWAAEEKCDLYIDLDEVPFIDKSAVEVIGEDMKSGYKRVRTKNKRKIDYRGMAREEVKFRKSFDRYDGFRHRIMEMADSKWPMGQTFKESYRRWYKEKRIVTLQESSSNLRHLILFIEAKNKLVVENRKLFDIALKAGVIENDSDKVFLHSALADDKSNLKGLYPFAYIVSQSKDAQPLIDSARAKIIGEIPAGVSEETKAVLIRILDDFIEDLMKNPRLKPLER